MNRRQFLSSVASIGVSAALPAKVVPIDPPYIELLEDIPFNLYPGAVNYVDMSAVQQKLIETLCMPNELLDRLPLDKPDEPCDARFAGRDQIG